MRIVLVGAVESSAVALQALRAVGADPALIVTLPPEAAARHSDFVDLGKIARGSPVFTTTSINSSEALEAIRSIAPDVCFVIGWSQICGEAFRAIAKLGTIGFHPSPLPRLRGRAVIPWTILQGEVSSASTLLWLDEGVDSGDLLLQRHFDVSSAETARTLYDKHTHNLTEMLPETVELVRSGSLPRLPQDHTNATYCAKRTLEDGLIDWRQPAEVILRFIRAVGDPYPGAFTFLDGHRLTIDRAANYSRSDRFVGLVGQVQALEDEHLVVRCGDGKCILATQWRVAPPIKPRPHARFRDGCAVTGKP
jgi:methionyl-tRNA formyltransferase